jgi:hypothetical protein
MGTPMHDGAHHLAALRPLSTVCCLLSALYCLVLPAPSIAAQDDDVRITADLSARRVWVGERVTLTYSLVRNVPAPDVDALVTPVRDVRLVEAPRFSDFWVNELEVEDPNQPGEPSTVGAVPLKRYRLFPLVAGRLRIEPPAYSMIVYPTTLGGVDPMPGTVTRRTEPLDVDVVPLPNGGRPATFGGAVGRFAVTAALEDARGKVGEVSRVRVEVRGDGNLEATGPPRFESVAGARLFPARRVSVDLGLKEPEANGRAVWLLDVIPERAGALALGPVALDYFDPVSVRYAVARSTPLALDVAPAAELPAPPAAESIGTSWGAWALWVALLAGALALGALVLKVARDRELSRVGQATAARPSAEATVSAEATARLRVRLAHAVASAEAARERGDARALHAHLLEGLGDLVASLYGVPASDLSRERLGEALAAAGVPRPVVERVVRLYDHCLEAGYAPRAAAPAREPIEAAARLFDALVRTRGCSS